MDFEPTPPLETVADTESLTQLVEKPDIDPNDRIARMRDIFDIDNLTQRITIAGIGAIGRQVAISLAAIGFKNVCCVDPDVIDKDNIGSQGWHPWMLGYDKTYAMAQQVADILPSNEWNFRKGRYPTDPYAVHSKYTIMCVDSMAARRAIVSHLSSLESPGPDTPQLIIDTRMNARTASILAFAAPDMALQFAPTYFPDDEIDPAPCTAKTTLYCAAVAANLAVATLLNAMHSDPADLPPAITINLLSMELTHHAYDNAVSSNQ